MTMDRRKASRCDVSQPQKLQFGDDPVAVRVRIRNLSPDGLMLDSGLPLAQGEAVRLPLAGQDEPVDARVVWKQKGRYGLAFDKPVDPALATPRKIRLTRQD